MTIRSQHKIASPAARTRRACRTVLHGIVAGILILLPLSALAAPLTKLSKSATFSRSTSAGSVAIASLSADQIDATIVRIQAREDELRTNPFPAEIAVASDFPTGATADEYEEWQRLTGRIITLFDGRVTNLRYLKDIRQSVRDLETNRKGWRGFSEKPPYPLSLVDSLQDSIRARQVELQTHEVRLSIADGELADYTANLRESRTQKRLAEERLERSLGKPDEERLRWLQALTSRRNDLNETGVVSVETQRQMLQEEVAWLRQELAFLDQKLAVAIGNVRFTREELSQKLKGLDARSEQVRQNLEIAVRAEEQERAEQERARVALQRYKERTSSSTVSPHLVALRQDLDVRQVGVETAGLKVLTLKAVSRLLKIERTVWESRYRIVNPAPNGTVPDIRTIQKDLATLEEWKEYLKSRLNGVDNHIRSQQNLITAPGLSVRDRETSRVLLAAYLQQKDFLLRVDEQLSGTEQLVQRLAGEVSARSGNDRRVASSMKRVMDQALSLAGKIWFTDLYVAEEVIIVDGQKIVKSRSVTVGKVIAALLIFIIGIMAARRGIGPVRRLAARKFNLSENDTQVFGRVIYYFIFICILVFSLTTVNIPLEVFAFFGGALAIGVGFGAQTLINNFISGLILLFDRSIRLNDVVEVNGQRGRVTAINIRSSRIRRFDGIEVLVPNSHFLQQNVVNLTLSDPHTRFEIAVGVAYGTPTRTAEEVITRAVLAQPEVRNDPTPFVVLEEFADSSLNFRAFFWVDLDPAVNSSIVRSEIRHRIAEYLAREAIDIPYPQRDLHLDTTRPLEVTIRENRCNGTHPPQSEP